MLFVAVTSQTDANATHGIALLLATAYAGLSTVNIAEGDGCWRL